MVFNQQGMCGVKNTSMSAADNNNIIDWNEVVKKEARGINGANLEKFN